MTALEKQMKVEEVLYEMCRCGDGCRYCDFFEPEDKADNKHWCAIRDKENRVPSDSDWDINSAMISN